ncbi:hypothetical protein GCM10009862_16200 [Microbacterium binotii]|uniref:Uncharacterized protein n=1 Tax=Microbacterium binotii TaxID=462710 RepID=A0ABN3PCG2_9MICO
MIDPDCRDGKHRACLGNAWDDENDKPTDCGCPCHVEVVDRQWQQAN